MNNAGIETPAALVPQAAHPPGRVRAILLVAGLYLLAGAAGLPLSLAWGYATPVWPAAGVAAAALVILGLRGWPGVWLGAWLIDLWLDPSLETAALATLTSAAAAGQALLSAWLVLRFLQQESANVVNDRRLLLSLLAAGPLACLASSSFGMAVLVFGGQIPRAELFIEWLRWWSGDTLGVLLFAPALWLLWPGRPPYRNRGDSRFALPLLATAALLVAGHVGLLQLEKLRTESEAHKLMGVLGHQAERGILEALGPLDGLAHFIAASERVTREEFGEYARSFVTHPALVSVDWAPRVTLEQRAAFEAAARREGFPDFRIFQFDGDGDGPRQPAPARPEYFPVLYGEPMALSRAVLGLDHGANPRRREAMDDARRQGQGIASGLIPLMRTQRREANLVYIPVWRRVGGQDRPELSGYVVGIFDMKQLFRPLLEAATANSFEVRIADITPGQPPQRLVDALPRVPEAQWKHDIRVGGRTWRVEMEPGAALRAPGSTPSERFFLGFSMLTALLATFATLSSAARHRTVSVQVAERTAQLQHELGARTAAEQALQRSEERYRRLIELSPFGILVQCDGRCVFVNASILAMFGAASQQELIGRRLIDFVHPDHHAVVLSRLARRAEGRPIPESAVVQYRRLDGRFSWVEFNSVPYEYEGRPGSLLLLNDISARIRAEEERDRFFTLSLDLFCIAGTDGRFRSVNPAFTHTLGWSEEELLSRPLIDFIHPDDVGETLAELARIQRGETTRGFENRYRCKDGSFRWLAWKAIPQPNGLLFASARDTTEQHRATEQLGELNAQLALRVREREQALARLHASSEEIRAVLDHLLECVITIDCRGVVQRVNPAVEPLLGYTPEELLGRNVSCLMPSPLREAHDGHLARYLLTGEKHIVGASREVTGRHKDGHPVPLELSVSEYAVNGERFFVGTLRDIREHKRLIASLTQAREDAEQADRAKSAFLATMSHEIRTPMNGVVGLIDVLAQDPLTERQAELIGMVRESSCSLLAIIDDILDFSKIEAGRLDIESTPLDLVGLIETLYNTHASVAGARGVVMELALAEDLPRWVRGDPVRLQQILGNLLSNAIKFSGGRNERQGRVGLRARVAVHEPLRIAIGIEDNGIGIAAEQLDTLFQPFTQAESSTTRRFGGTGLGLAICRRLVDLLGGEITVASTPGVGSVFTVILPLEAAPPVVEAPEPAPPGAAAAPATARILVVEDDAVNRQVIRHQLTLLGHAFEIACDGAEALQMWRRERYDLVLTDLHMPEMDGYELASRIRAEEDGRARIPILMLTAHVLRGEALQATEAGIDDYLTKPVRLKTLRAALGRWLARAQAGASAAPQPQPREAGVFDRRTLRELVGEDEDMVLQILREYAQSLRQLAPGLASAVERGDAGEAGRIAHRLKSSSRAVGALQLGELCAGIERAAQHEGRPAVTQAAAEFTRLAQATVARIEELLAGSQHDKGLSHGNEKDTGRR